MPPLVADLLFGRNGTRVGLDTEVLVAGARKRCHKTHYIGAAVVDRRFCRDLLDGDRQKLLAEFDLSPEQQAGCISILGQDMA